MDDLGVLEGILRGARPDEDPLDVLHMCFVANNARMRRGKVRASYHVSGRIYYLGLRTVGEILCPIFTPVKPVSYLEGMTEARRQFRGIATDPPLQLDYAETMIELAEQGYLDTLRAAIDARLWARLGRGSIA